MKEVDYQDFSLRLHSRADSAQMRIPLNATLELTYRCNNRCVHCYCNLPIDDEKARSVELSRDEIEDLFDALRDMGCLWLLITGGEPLLRHDFPDIYLSAKRHGFIITLFTNGTLITDDIADLLAKYPPFVVEVTMYGAMPETYERVTRAQGSYERYRAGLRRLVERAIKVKLKSMVLTINQNELHQMDALARELGCDFRFDPIVHGRIDRKHLSTPEHYRLSAEDVIKLDIEFPERMEAHKEFCERMSQQSIEKDRLIICGAGRSSLHIMPDGMVLPCSMLINEGESLRETLIRDIWKVNFENIRNRKKDFELECDICSLHGACAQCIGWSLVEHGTIGEKVQYLCDIMEKRALSLGLVE